METLGSWLQQKREEKGWSRLELARREGVSQPFITKIEEGQTKHPRWDSLQMIANTLKMAQWKRVSVNQSSLCGQNGSFRGRTRRSDPLFSIFTGK